MFAPSISSMNRNDEKKLVQKQQNPNIFIRSASKKETVAKESEIAKIEAKEQQLFAEKPATDTDN